jgi:hypothetical protein
MIEKLSRAIRRPELIRRKAGIVAARPFTKGNYETVDFLNEDWDILIVLDACRYDMFAELNPFDVPIQRVHSNASHTREYIQNNYADRDCLDTVYVTASPQFADFDLQFAHIDHVWRDNWDDELQTVRPEAVTDAALDMIHEYEKKRIIVHYMQPHYPFIGPTGRKLSEQATFVPNPQKLSVWEQLSAGKIDEDTVRTAYRENLSIVLPEVQRLVSQINDKCVITSDHGNLFGQKVCWLPIRIHGHPSGIHHPELTSVPWVELPFDSRRKITRDDHPTQQSDTFDDVEDRLADLGYLE